MEISKINEAQMLGEHGKNGPEATHWMIDRKVPIALIFAVIIQTMAFTWGAASLSSSVETNGDNIAKLETKIESLDVKLDALNEKIASRPDKDDTRQIENRLNRLENRVRDIEKQR